VAPALGYDVVKVHSTIYLPSYITHHQSSWQAMLSLLSEHRGYHFMLVGSVDFLKPFWEKYAMTHLLFLAALVGKKPPISWGCEDKALWSVLPHLQCDGVSSRTWWCGSSQGGLSEVIRTNSGRHLQDIVDHKGYGRPFVCLISTIKLGSQKRHVIPEAYGL
jgi:hypothetical protein